MLEWVILVLVVSLLLYVLLGGADFGAGILELFYPRASYDQLKKTTYKAIGPVWEANHVWLIIVIVILFNGFPPAFRVISTYLHIPLMLMLLGIIGRGSAFVFRHYDAIKGKSEKVYSRIFAWSSLITPFILGVTAGAVLFGRINPDPPNFYEGYIAPWWNWFAMSIGLFTTCLFAFLAAAFLIPEMEENRWKNHFRKQALIANFFVVGAGGIVFLAGLAEHFSFTRIFFSHPVSIICFLLATASLGVLIFTLRKERDQHSRLLAGFQVSMIVLGWLSLQYPYIITYSGNSGLTLQEAAASGKVIAILGIALAAGVFLILPALGYLMWVFKYRKGLQ